MRAVHEHADFPLPAGLPHDWRLDQDLPCPVCDFNLRTARTPRCNECGTTFRWQTLLQVGCPRCGVPLFEHDDDACPKCKLDLNWALLLGRADPARFRLFEYARRPILTALGTWFLSIFPARFWRRIPLESPPNVRRLRWLQVWAWVAFFVGVMVFAAVNIFLARVSRRLINPFEVSAAYSLSFAVPPIVTAFLLPVFSQTLAKYRIRRDQMLRVSAFSLCGLVWLSCAFVGTGTLLLVLNASGVVKLNAWGMRIPFYIDPREGFGVFFALAGAHFQALPLSIPFWMGNGAFVAFTIAIGVLWWLRFIFVAFRDYLRLRLIDAWALLLSTQVIALLASVLLLLQNDAWARFVGSILALGP